MALMALHGEAGLDQFNEKNLHDPAIREFMEKVLTLEEMQQLAKSGAFMEFTNYRDSAE
jgi:2-methylcitrate dehydratase PrpD